MKKPNILYIMSDDHAANSISCYNSILSEVYKTPNLDRIANEGCRMDDFCATNAICTPARATIMTGQYGQLNGVRTLDDSWDIDNCPDNLATLLKNAGYKTGVIGKWHLGCDPTCFDEYKFLSDENETKQGQQGVYQNPTFKEKGKGIVQYNGYVTDIISEMAQDFIKSTDNDTPFFLMCHHKAPHDFWEFAERHENIFDGIEIPVPKSLFEDKSHRSEGSKNFGSSVTPRSKIRSLYEDFSAPDYVTGPLVCDENATFEEKGYAAYQKYLKDYLRTTAGIDDSVGALLKTLEEKGVLEDTVVIYTSDQGMFLGEHDYQDKRWSFEESLRTPLMIRYPKLIKAGTVCNELMSNIDIAPTLLDLAGCEIPNEMQGISCVNMISGEEQPYHEYIYFRYWMHLAHRHDNPAHYGIRTKKYKLTFYYGMGLDASGAATQNTPPGFELYDLEKDPLELQNVYDNKDYYEIREELKIKLLEAKKFYKDEDENYPELLSLYKEMA